MNVCIKKKKCSLIEWCLRNFLLNCRKAPFSSIRGQIVYIIEVRGSKLYLKKKKYKTPSIKIWEGGNLSSRLKHVWEKNLFKWIYLESNHKLFFYI